MRVRDPKTGRFGSAPDPKMPLISKAPRRVRRPVNWALIVTVIGLAAIVGVAVVASLHAG